MKRSSSRRGIPSPLLITNLRVPHSRQMLMARNALIERMDRALGFPLTLIAAPAGFGKTTLLSQWVASNRNEKLQNCIAWVSVDDGCDVGQFWRYVTAALEGLRPGTGRAALVLLETPEPAINKALRILINEVAAIADDLVLVLDDYDHVDEPAIHATLAFLINHLPPNLHLVIASRSYPPLPLARWRASNSLFELREEDLRFSSEETASFLNETRGLNLSAEDVVAVDVRTEGWAAGLQLVALSLEDLDEVSKHRFVADFTGSQRYILDYLLQEVLQRQSDNIRTFLLQTSVLDQLSTPLCNAITERGDGQVVLEHLERAQLFTVPLDSERRWYRYHHLFLDVLRHRLQQEQPDVPAELHRRAATWYAEAGQTDDAIRHACLAVEWGQAIALIEPAIGAAWSRGEIRKIIAWLGKLPNEYLDPHPHLSLYYSRALLLGGQMEAAEQRLREAEKVLRARLSGQATTQDRVLLGTICAFRTTIAAVTGETASALEMGDEALSLLPPENLDIRAHAVNSLGVNHYYHGDMEEAGRACAEAGDLAQQVGNLYLAMVAAAYHAKALVCQGQLTRAGKILERALDLGTLPGQPVQSWIPAASVICANLGNLLYEWNRLEEAEHYLTEAVELGERLAFGSALWSAYHTLAGISLARRDQAGGQTMIQQAQRYRLAHSVPLPPRLMDAEQARADLALGRWDAAARWAAAIHPDRVVAPTFVQEVEDLTLARIYLFQGQPELALSLLDRLRPFAESSRRRGHLIEIMALGALAQHVRGASDLAINTLTRALEMAEPEGYLRTFVDEGQPMAALLYQILARGTNSDYVSRLLALFPTDSVTVDASPSGVAPTRAQPANSRLIEPLSQRELEVLQLIANGASNQDIAEALTITITTAKKHVSNIIQKLGVDNRTQAAAKCRQLSLC